MTPTPPEGKEQPGTHSLGPICGPHKGDPLSRQMLEKVIVAVMEEPPCATCAGMNDLVATQGQRIAELERERGEAMAEAGAIRDLVETLLKEAETAINDHDERQHLSLAQWEGRKSVLVGMSAILPTAGADLLKELEFVRKGRKTALAQLAASEKDRERLDWLVSREAYVSFSRDREFCNVWYRWDDEGQDGGPVEGYPQKCHLDPRAAIDAAMKEAK